MSSLRTITVLGADGWIGRALVFTLKSKGRLVRAVGRAELTSWLENQDPQGPVIYAIGLTADFRKRPHATAHAHVGLLSMVLQRRGVEQLLLLSSTRVYARSTDTRETAPVPCLSSDQSDLYNLSKLMGEALVLQDSRPSMKVVRLSNVVGPNQPVSTFLGELMAGGRDSGFVTIREPPNTSKNYVAMADVVRLLPLIAEQGQHRLYNLGSSSNTSHAEVAAWLERQGANVGFAPFDIASSGLTFPKLAIERLAAEFGAPGDPFRQTLFSPFLLA